MQPYGDKSALVQEIMNLNDRMQLLAKFRREFNPFQAASIRCLLYERNSFCSITWTPEGKTGAESDRHLLALVSP